MMLACFATFGPLFINTEKTQKDIFDAYKESLWNQSELIHDTTKQATQWLFTQTLLNTDKEVFVGVIEPADRAVDTLWGAVTATHYQTVFRNAIQNKHPDFGLISDLSEDGTVTRRELAQRSWQELQNQWRCANSKNKLCSGRVDSLYAALVTEQMMGSSWILGEGGKRLSKTFLADGNDVEGGTTTLHIDSNQNLWGQRCATLQVDRIIDGCDIQEVENNGVAVLENYSSADEPWFTVQSAEAENWTNVNWTAVDPNSSMGEPIKLWSRLYYMDPWTRQASDAAGPDCQDCQLGFSWTYPIAYCGNYSCFSGVVSADLTLDRVNDILYDQWRRLQDDLRQDPWQYNALSLNTSSIFIINQDSPRFPAQEGALIGCSHSESCMDPDQLNLATESQSKVVATAARAVLLKYGGSWKSVMNTGATDDEVPKPFYFSKSKLLADGELDSEECSPLNAAKNEQQGDPDCFQIATHTVYMDQELKWLMVVVLPSEAFNKQSTETLNIQSRAEEEMRDAEDQTKETMLWTLISGAIIAVISLSFNVGLSFLVLRPLDRLGFLMKRLGQLDFARESREFRKLHDGVKGFVTEVNDLQDGFCRLSKSIEIFARFVPETVVRGLVRGEDRKLRPYVDPRNVTIMFSDIRDFTTISEQLSPDDLVFVLYLYLNDMIGIIESEGGVVAEVLGDGLLAFWNTPDNVKHHAAKACNAALRQQQQLRIINEKLADQGLPQLAIRVGVHTGQVLTGNLGSDQKMKFGCMGDPVNLASRLEGLCKVYGVDIMISGKTHEALPSASGFACRQLDLVQVKGKKEPTTIFELMGRDIPTQNNIDEFEPCLGVDPARKAQAAKYEQALTAWQNKEFQKCVDVAKELPESDVAGKKLLERARGYVTSKWSLPGASKSSKSLTPEELENWTGVVGMNEK
jgi:class 3 adenylate cyclase